MSSKTVSKQYLTTIVVAVSVAISTTIAGIVWVEERIHLHSEQPHAGAVSDSQFQQYLSAQNMQMQQVLDRLQSIEEAIRTR